MGETVLLTEAEARDLTARACAAGEDLAQTLLELHEGEARRVMGHGPWAAYVAGEFEFTRGRSYQLLAQATVERAVEGPRDHR